MIPEPRWCTRVLSEMLGGPVYLKCENLQRAGLSRVRGAYLMIACLADADPGANVLEVGYERMGPRLDVDQAAVVLVVEARGPGHCDEVIGAVCAANYTLAFG